MDGKTIQEEVTSLRIDGLSAYSNDSAIFMSCTGNHTAQFGTTDKG